MLRSFFIFFTLLLPCAGVRAEAVLPAPGGPHAVGRLALPGTGQVPAAWLYYPAQAGGTGAQVMPAALAAARRPVLVRRYGERAAALLTAMRGRAVDGAAPAGGARPLLVFAPGLGQGPLDYAILLEELASHGYAVAGVVPREGSGDGYERLAQDIVALARELRRAALDPRSTLYGRLDAERYGAFGHSLGGAASVLAAGRDPRILAAANLDGDFDGAAAQAQLAAPTLYVVSEAPAGDNWLERWRERRSEARRDALWAELAAQGRGRPLLRLRLRGARHGNFFDAAALPAGTVPDGLRASRFGPLAGLRGLAVTSAAVRALFERRDAQGVAAAVRPYPEATLERTR